MNTTQNAVKRFEFDFAQAEALLTAYQGARPRYTSYPTAPVWTESYGATEFREDLTGLPSAPADALSLYAHVPFCTSLCHFCACNRMITRDPGLPEAYLDAIEQEIGSVRALIDSPPAVTQLHWGGGTPTHLEPGQIERLFSAMVDAFPLADGAEISIEIDPRVTTLDHVAALERCGFNRVSMGVQDFDPTVQQAIHRVQSQQDTGELAAACRRAGFESVNFDLIYGLPYQTEASFERTLDAVLELSPDRVALYAYAHVTWVAKQQRGFERKDLPDPKTRLRIMLLAIRRFLEAGYVYIGMDHFAKPKDELAVALGDRTLRRNFMGYTTQASVRMLGFGPSAISDLGASYAQSERAVDTWREAVDARGLATLRGHRLGREDRLRRWVIECIMCLGELDADNFSQEFGESLREHFPAELAALDMPRRDGLLTLDPEGGFRLTPLGHLLVRNVAAVFDAYLPEQEKTSKRLFSEAI
jgi:oxygen-independent coproporphyrinogen-3 oxidase